MSNKITHNLIHFHRNLKLHIAGGLVALLAVASGSAMAQSNAAKSSPAISNYRIVVGFGAGGVPDSAARLIAAKLSERLKVPAIVESKLGAGGTIAAQNVLSSPADGSTMLSVSPAHATAPAIFKKMPYDTLADFTPVTMIGDGPALLVVPNDLKVRTVAELVAYAKSNPGKLNYSSAGVGSSSHFAAELLNSQAGMDIVHVPFKGIGEALTEVMTGRVQFHIAPYLSAAALVKSGKLRVLAVTSKNRIADLPDVPTVAESGVPGYEWTFWYGILVSAKTPATTVEFLNKEIVAILGLPDVKRQLEQMAVTVSGSSSESFRKLITAETAKFLRIAKSANILPE